MWTIYSIGDSAFLDAVLNGVAMVTATADFIDMLKVGMLIGVLIMFLQSLWNGGRGIDFGQAFVAFIVLSIAFIPKTDVAIEDVYDGSVRNVANVPLGVVAAGSIISHVGYNITEAFETAFSTPAMTEYGFADPLNTLAGIRKLEMAQTELMRSWNNYIKECTLIGVDRGDKRLEDILEQSPFMAQLQWDSQIFGTEIYVTATGANAPAQFYNCTDAYGVLSAASTSAGVLDSLYSNVAPQLGAADAAEAQAKVTDAMNQMGGAMIGVQNEWMIATALMPAYQSAVEGKYVDEMAYTHALMANQAIAQRNTQWAAESTMFQSIVRPLMTFLEGFTYAVTPIMAFVLSIAPIGGKMAGKYLLTLVWISMWQPVMAVINLYILMSASGKMQALDSLSAPVTSYIGMQEANQEIQNWLATGGMLASATPALSLMLVYGSAITATHLAGRLGGGDHVDETQTAPSLAKTSPAMNVGNLMETTAVGGVAGAGHQQVMGGMNMGSMLSNATSSASSKMQTAQSTLSSNFSDAFSEMSSKSSSVEALSSFGQHVASSNSQLFQAAKSQMESWGYNYKQGDQQSEAILGAVAGKLSGSVGAEFFGNGVTAELAGSAGTNSQTQKSMSSEDLFNKLKDVKASDQMRASYQDELASSMSDSHKTGFEEKLGATKTSDLSKNLSDSASATRQFSELSEFKSAYGHGVNTDINTMAEHAVNSGQMGSLRGYIGNNHDLQQAINGKDGSGGFLAMAESAGLSGDKAYAAAAMMAMAQSGDSDHLNQLAGIAGWNPSLSGAGQNAGMDAPTYGAATDAVNAGNARGDALRAETGQGIATGAAAATGDVTGHHAAGVADAGAFKNNELAGAHGAAYDQQTEQLLRYTPDSEVAGHLQSLKEKIGSGTLGELGINMNPEETAAREQEIYQQARDDHHLTRGQAALYAAMSVSGGGLSDAQWNQLTGDIHGEFKEWNDETKRFEYIENGEALANKQIELVSDAALLGEEYGAGHMAAVSGFNEATGRTNVRSNNYDAVSY